MNGELNAQKRDIAISVVPLLDCNVEYFSSKRIILNVTNRLATPILIDDVTLCFQPDSGAADIYLDTPLGLQIAPNEVAPISVEVTPTPEYMEYTNCFHVLVHYRIGDRLDERLSARRDSVSYLIIKPPAQVIGNAFISFKQMEDMSLARLLEVHARRAGLNPYIVLNQPEPGRDQWDRIEEAIQGSSAAFIIWGTRTEWGTGVQKEVGLCRKHAVPEILLLERNIGVPELFRGTQIEYLKFDSDNPRSVLSKAVQSVRNRLLQKRP
jgi:hypothetical protein